MGARPGAAPAGVGSGTDTRFDAMPNTSATRGAYVHECCSATLHTCKHKAMVSPSACDLKVA